MHKLVFIGVLLFFNFISAQEIKILDIDTRQPISNVVLYTKDKSKTTLSDVKGNCDLAIFDKGERIIFKHISYQTRKISKGQLLKRSNYFYLALKTEELEEVVMSISKWEQQKKDIPQKIAAIDARTIAFTTPQTAADLLQNSGKVYVQKSQLGGGSPMIRGFATNRVLITVDGVRMNNAIFRGGNVQNVIAIDPFSIKNTEVIFGPGSVIYGSDAIGGVMNFFTKKPLYATNDSINFSGKANYRYASANNENTFHAAFNIGKEKWAFLTSTSYTNFSDLTMGVNGPNDYLRTNYVVTNNGEDILVANENPRRQVKSGYNQINLTQKIAFKPNNNWDFNLGTYYSKTSDFDRYDRLIRPNSENNGLRSAEWFYGPQEWFMGNLQVLQKGKSKFYDGLKITTAYQHFKESRNNRDFNTPIRYINTEKVAALSTNIDFENKRIGNLRLYYGGEYIFNKVSSVGNRKNIQTGELSSGPTRYPHGATWQTLAGYVNGEYKAKPNFTFLAGLRYSHVWTNATFDKTFFPFPFDDANLSTGALTGSIGFSWFPKADFQITFNGSTGFRSPNLDDVGKVFDSEPGAVVVPNLDLEPEYAYNAEFGIQRNFNDKIVCKGAAYYTYLVDALVRRNYAFNGQTEINYNGRLSQVQAIQNAAKTYVYGFEFGIDAFITEHVSLMSNLTITKGVEEDNNGIEVPVRHVAPTFGDVHLIWKNQHLKTDLFLNYNGVLDFSDLAPSEKNKEYLYAIDENGNPYSPSWLTLNFRSQYLFTNKIKTTLGIENITNKRYRTYSSGISAPGFQIIWGLEVKF